MTVPVLPDTDRLTQYTISVADDGPYSVGFDIYADGSDYTNFIEVWLDDVQQSGNWTLTSPTGSLSTIARPITDAEITFTSTITGVLTIVGARRPRRTSIFADGQAVPSNLLNYHYNDLMAAMREFWDLRARMFLAAPGSTATFVEDDLAAAAIATLVEAQAGTVNTRVMTPLRVRQSIMGALRNERLAKTALYTVANTDNGKTIALGGSSFYTLTFSAASGYDSTFAVTVINEDTVRAKSIACNGLTTFKLYPGQSCVVANQNNVWKTYGAPTRWRPTSAVTLYVAASGGSDTTNDGLNSAAPFATIQKAIDTHFFDIDHNNTGPIISLADGTYTESAVIVRGSLFGFHYIQFTGNIVTPSNVIWQAGSGGYCLGVRDYGIGVLAGIKFQAGAGGTTSGQNGLLASQWGNIDFSNVVFGAFPNGNQVMIQSGGGINPTGSYSITGGASAHFYMYGPGHILTSGSIVVTISAVTYSTAYVQMVGCGGVISIDPTMTFSGAGAGAGTTGPKFSVDPLNKLDLNSVTLPGATAGSYGSGKPIQSDGTIGIGYAAGSGGTVSQGTDKSTTVVLSKFTGNITMNAAALNAATAVSFTLTNTLIAATDHVLVSHISGGTLGAYTVTAVGGGGSASITIRNNTAGNLSEAVVLKFTVVKTPTT